LQAFGAEGADRSRTPRVKCAEMKGENRSYGMPQRPNMVGVASWTASTLKVWHGRQPWLCQRGVVTRKRVGRVKGAV
jgi:hypothetical protein